MKVSNKNLIIKSLSRTIKLQNYRCLQIQEINQFNSIILYRFTCQGCGCNYINKTERTSHERTSNHAQPNKNSNDQIATYEDL